MSRTIIHLIFSPCSYAVYTTPTTSFATNDTPDYSTSSFVATVVLWATLGPHGNVEDEEHGPMVRMNCDHSWHRNCLQDWMDTGDLAFEDACPLRCHLGLV